MTSTPTRRRPEQPGVPASGPRGPCGGAAATTSGRWRSERRCSVPSIRTRRQASTTSPSCFRPRAISPAHVRFYERALAICEKALGPEHLHTAMSLGNLGFLLQAQGDLADARPLLERALAISEKALGPEHPDTATIRNNLANLLSQAR